MLAPMALPSAATAAAVASTNCAAPPLAALDRALQPLGRQREIGVAGEIAGKHFGRVDDDAGLARRFIDASTILRAGDDEIAAEDQVGVARRDADRVDVLGRRAPA